MALNGAGASRRAVVIAGHLGDESTARDALGGRAPAYRASALAALARMGALEEADLLAGLRDPAPEVRRRACDLAGRHRLPALAGALVTALADAVPSVVEAACYALGELGLSRAVAPLSTTARSHTEPLCREAAVAALGAIGDPAGLPAVLGALCDKPAVRRRAVVALAAFDGPLAERAVAEAAKDRDWQVRQLAEDLLFSS